jgi:hypothetical protein
MQIMLPNVALIHPNINPRPIIATQSNRKCTKNEIKNCFLVLISLHNIIVVIKAVSADAAKISSGRYFVTDSYDLTAPSIVTIIKIAVAIAVKKLI